MEHLVSGNILDGPEDRALRVVGVGGCGGEHTGVVGGAAEQLGLRCLDTLIELLDAAQLWPQPRTVRRRQCGDNVPQPAVETCARDRCGGTGAGAETATDAGAEAGAETGAATGTGEETRTIRVRRP